MTLVALGRRDRFGGMPAFVQLVRPPPTIGTVPGKHHTGSALPRNVRPLLCGEDEPALPLADAAFRSSGIVYL